MMKYGISEIGQFYAGDMRFLAIRLAGWRAARVASWQVGYEQDSALSRFDCLAEGYGPGPDRDDEVPD